MPSFSFSLNTSNNILFSVIFIYFLCLESPILSRLLSGFQSESSNTDFNSEYGVSQAAQPSQTVNDNAVIKVESFANKNESPNCSSHCNNTSSNKIEVVDNMYTLNQVECRETKLTVDNSNNNLNQVILFARFENQNYQCLGKCRLMCTVLFDWYWRFHSMSIVLYHYSHTIFDL